MGKWIVAVAMAALVSLSGAVSAAAEKVTVTRDSHGEPHISASTAAGAMYGLARAQMEDQGPYILGAIVAANGQSAEFNGPACLPACFASDQTVRLLKIPETAAANFSNLPPDIQARLRGFAAGINSYVAEHPERLPSWAGPVSAIELLASTTYPFLMGQLTAAAGGTTDFEDGADDGSDATVVAYMSGEGAVEEGASNGLVLAGSRTASGKPLLVGDPHLAFEGSTRWYGASLSYPGTRVRGVTLRGAAGIAIGANDDVAWTHTANHGNTYEFQRYREDLDPAHPDSYLYGGKWTPMEIRQVPIRVQTGPGEFTSVSVRLRYTVHGPVISDPLAKMDGTQAAPGTDQAISASLSLFGQYRLAEQIARQNDADSLAEFKQAMSLNQSSGFHVLAAGKEGIYYSSGGRNALVKAGMNLRQPLDGTDPTTAWQGIMPFSQVPHADSPESGWLQNSNNSPWYSAPGVIAKANVPYQLALADSNGPRSRRLLDLLPTIAGLDQEGAEALAKDTYIQFSPTMKSLLQQAAVAGSQKVKAGSALIGNWDGRADATSTAYPLFATWLRALDDSALGFKYQNAPEPPPLFSGPQLVAARQAMNKAYDGMIARYGRIDVRLGDLRKVSRGNFTGPVDGGDFDVPALRMAHCKGQPGASSPTAYQPCVASGGSSFTFEIDMGSSHVLRYNRPVSNGDDPSSPFITRNTEDFANGTFRVMPTTGAQVAATRSRTETFRVPGTYPKGFKALSRRARAGDKGGLSIRVHCPGTQPSAGKTNLAGRCNGWIQMRAIVRAGRRGKPLKFKVGFRRLDLKPADATWVRLRLNRRGRKALHRRGHLAVGLELKLKSLGDSARSYQRIKVR
ncbi:MAG: penicillin acylase family protein [Solirubrobacterales bacterium]|nr:penicillin acylase family protein [Solirubrobacterales bacterium]